MATIGIEIFALVPGEDRVEKRQHPVVPTGHVHRDRVWPSI